MSKAKLARDIRTGQYVPDILDCLAQLSNDEVPTPPNLARAMLDLLPDEVWTRPDYKWLDPFSKSGVFLREIAARLLVSLEDSIPDFEQRREHIYRNMLYGTSITEMTGRISRRSLYYSRDASGEHSVIEFDKPEGNLPFVRADHTFRKKKDGTVDGGCVHCGGPLELERGPGRENHAYSFIHGQYPTQELEHMKFDVIVGNPPYQLKGGGGGTNDSSIYHLFVEQAILLEPRYISMIIPSRWIAGGRGLKEFRSTMLKSRRIRKFVDYTKMSTAFPGVDFEGGVGYFLWDRDNPGQCEYQLNIGEQSIPVVTRHLDTHDILVRDSRSLNILEKVQELNEPTLDSLISADTPFGLATNFKDYSLDQGRNQICDLSRHR